MCGTRKNEGRSYFIKVDANMIKEYAFYKADYVINIIIKYLVFNGDNMNYQKK